LRKLFSRPFSVTPSSISGYSNATSTRIQPLQDKKYQNDLQLPFPKPIFRRLLPGGSKLLIFNYFPANRFCERIPGFKVCGGIQIDPSTQKANVRAIYGFVRECCEIARINENAILPEEAISEKIDR
jgi:hypothetical protein